MQPSRPSRAISYAYHCPRARSRGSSRARLAVRRAHPPPPPPPAASSCAPPAASSVPNYNWPNFRKGEHDDAYVQTQIETLVQSLACDVTRTAALNFWAAGDPGFVTEFAPATSPYIAGNWH